MNVQIVGTVGQLQLSEHHITTQLLLPNKLHIRQNITWLSDTRNVLGTFKQDKGAEVCRTILLQMAKHTARVKQHSDIRPHICLSFLVKQKLYWCSWDGCTFALPTIPCKPVLVLGIGLAVLCIYLYISKYTTQVYTRLSLNSHYPHTQQIYKTMHFFSAQKLMVTQEDFMTSSHCETASFTCLISIQICNSFDQTWTSAESSMLPLLLHDKPMNEHI
jgi:hypothetical protein